MRRGFKTEAREIAREQRDELHISMTDPLDPWALSKNLDIPIWPLETYANTSPQLVHYLTAVEPGAFSAMLAFDGMRRVIIHNHAHALTRQRANIAHELAHALLLHVPHPARAGRAPHFDAEQEEEAAWLGSVLLVPDEYCLACCRQHLEVAAAAAHMMVSPQLMQWRLNMSGAKHRFARTKARAR